MTEYVPAFKPGQAVTYKAGAAITGGQVVEITSAGVVQPAGADSAAVVGIAGFDAKVNDPVTVFSGGVQKAIASAVIAPGVKVNAAENGQIAPVGSGANPIGLAISSAAVGAQARFINDNR